MKIVLLGPPGAGKGTYASRLSKVLGIPHISTGDLVRDEISAETNQGRIAREYSARGELVPNDIIIEMLERKLRDPEAEGGWILDGFPRTIEQAEALQAFSKIDIVFNLMVPDEIIVQRLSNRITCETCGAIFNNLTLKPRITNTCDNCGSRLRQREDDKPAVISERLAVYHKKTKPLIDHYRKRSQLRNVLCESLLTPPETIVEKILADISRESKTQT